MGLYFPLQDTKQNALNVDHPNDLRIHSLETFGTHDGPGVRMVIFVQGCQFRCLYCQNVDTLDVNGGTMVSIDELVTRAIHQKDYFGSKGGVTVSGGEPLLQRSKLIIFFKKLHENGINTCLDSNGRLLDNEVKELLHHTDLILLDVKHIDDEWHHKLCGVSNKPTLKLAEYCESVNQKMWLRYVLVPGWNDQPEFIERWAKQFTGYKNVDRVEILPYHQLGMHKWRIMGLPYQLTDVPTPSSEIKERVLHTFQKYFADVRLK